MQESVVDNFSSLCYKPRPIQGNAQAPYRLREDTMKRGREDREKWEKGRGQRKDRRNEKKDRGRQKRIEEDRE